jgi:hypothetical protein
MITLPIFVIDGLDVSVYSSLRDLQFDLEPIDIQNDVFTVYDADGRLIHLKTDGKNINAILSDDEPPRTTELEVILREHLKATNNPLADDLDCHLPCLVESFRKLPS